ncbi:MAG: hypothetical protein J6M93_04035 [Succinivibrio sp.]|nr:hypothetical protein [Succinivibrio sp.]
MGKTAVSLVAGLLLLGAVTSSHADELSLRAYELMDQSPEEMADFFKRDALTKGYLLYEPETIRAFYEERVGHAPPADVITDDFHEELDLDNAYSLFSFMMHNDVQSGRRYKIPIVLRSSEGFDINTFDEFYHDGLCAGMGFMEADFKMKCYRVRDNYGLVEVHLPPAVLGRKEALSYPQNSVPQNGVLLGYPYLVYSAAPALFGLRTNIGEKGLFNAPSSFDRNLFSQNLGAKIFRGLSLSSLGNNCSLTHSENCRLIFLGSNVSRLLGLNIFNPDPASSDLLKVKISKDGQVSIQGRNTILSDSSFINYGFYTEAELNILRDLGYRIEPREFFGYSIYSSGSPLSRVSHVVGAGFFAWNSQKERYESRTASSIPLSIGTHVYGSFNEVRQEGLIASVGAGAVGIRVDGSFNDIEIPEKANVIENGYGSSGVAFTYGRNNTLSVRGSVTAPASDATALRFDFGSNAKSDLLEYRGSYMVVQTLKDHSSDRDEDRETPVYVPDELRGPLVTRADISGTLEGGKAAILIGERAYVKEIHLTGRARVRGNVISLWDPFIMDGLVYSKQNDSRLSSGLLQFESSDDYAFLRENSLSEEEKLDYLRTLMVFGTEESNDQGSLFSESYNSDIIRIFGNISGSSLLIKSVHGLTDISGYIRVNSIEIKDSVLRLSSDAEQQSIAGRFRLLDNGVLDLVNDEANSLIIQGDSFLDSSSLLRLDADEEGNILDDISLQGKIVTPEKIINVEPGVSFDNIKMFSSNPKSLLYFMTNFVQNANRKFGPYGVAVRFPRHMWFSTGDIGREVRCSNRGCHIGEFVSVSKTSSHEESPWRYLVSLIGCILILFLTWFFMHRRTDRV